MAQMLTPSQSTRTTVDAPLVSTPRSVPVRLVRRVVDVFQVRTARTAPRAMPARIVMVAAIESAAPSAPTVLSAPRLPIRLLPRETRGSEGHPATDLPAPRPETVPLRIPIRVAAPASRPTKPRRGSAFYYRIAITALLVGGVVTVLGPATFATFSAATTNSALITTGTLVLGNTVNVGTECFSYTGGVNTIDSLNSNAGCDTTWSVAGTSAEPGVPITAPKVIVALRGSLVASTFTLSARPTATPANPACVSTATAGETYNGGANICNVLQIYVQQYTSNSFGTPLKCLYGAGFGTSTCTGFDATHTLTDFGSCHKPTSNLACGGGEANGPVTIAVPVGAPPTSYFKVFANFPLNVGNTYQGQSANLGFTWTISQ